MAKVKTSADIQKKKKNGTGKVNPLVSKYKKESHGPEKKKNVKSNKKIVAKENTSKPMAISKPKIKKPKNGSLIAVEKETNSTMTMKRKRIDDAVEVGNGPKDQKKKIFNKTLPEPSLVSKQFREKEVVEKRHFKAQKVSKSLKVKDEAKAPKGAEKIKKILKVDDVDESVTEAAEIDIKSTKGKKKNKKALKVNNVDESETKAAEIENKATKGKKKNKNSLKAINSFEDEDPISAAETEEVAQPKKKLQNSMAVDSSNEEIDSGTEEEEAAEGSKSVSVFVGNLPINTKRLKLLKMFSKFGKIKSIRFRLSNGAKFFKSQSKVTAPNVIAFVDFESIEDARSSLVLNGEKLKDNVIRVNLQSVAKTGENFDAKRTVFVGNLKFAVTDQRLHEFFSCCGEIEYTRAMQSNKGCNGVGYVCFKKPESVGMALELHNTELLGRAVRVQRYSSKATKDSKGKQNEKNAGTAKGLNGQQNFKKSQNKSPNSKKQFVGMKAKNKKTLQKSKKPLKGPKLLAKKIASRDKSSVA